MKFAKYLLIQLALTIPFVAYCNYLRLGNWETLGLIALGGLCYFPHGRDG